MVLPFKWLLWVRKVKWTNSHLNSLEMANLFGKTTNWSMVQNGIPYFTEIMRLAKRPPLLFQAFQLNCEK
ncbi:Uncharacterised protein [Vibrio cholerae]|nr:Uncharacterised protein [Vibrio cholerae]